MCTRWVVLTLLCVTACKKADKPAEPDKATVEEAPPAATAGKPVIDPWTKPPTLSGNLAERAGGGLAKIDDVWGTKSPTLAEPGGGKGGVPTFASKIELADVEKPVETKVELKTLTGSEANGFKVTYNPSRNQTHETFRKLFEEQKVFDTVAEGLNKTIRLPISVDINTVDCNTINAFYDPNTKRIIVCYELVSYFLGVFKPTAKSDAELGSAVLGALIFSFFHESGHGLIDILQLPAVGREEDSVDQLATLILISSGDEGVQMALSGAYWFHLQSQGEQKTPFWDEHAFDGQRFYNIVCLIYGSNPEKYGEFVTSGALPKDRAVRCPEEYAKINKAWERLLQPFLTNGAALNINYKPPVPVTEAPKKTTEDPWGEAPAAPAAKEEPAPAPAPAPPASAKHAVTCEQVAVKAGELITAEARQRAQTMSEDEVEELSKRVQTELPAVVEQILAECAKQDWSDSARSCVMKAETLDQATKCN